MSTGTPPRNKSGPTQGWTGGSSSEGVASGPGAPAAAYPPAPGRHAGVEGEVPEPLRKGSAAPEKRAEEEEVDEEERGDVTES